MNIQYRCPECGDENGLYMRADIRWNPAEQSWKHVDGSEEDHAVDCTECDWTGDMVSCEYDADEEPCPIHRQPISRCPDTCNHGA